MTNALMDPERRNREENAVEAVVTQVRQRLLARVDQGGSIIELGPVEQVADIIVERIPEKNPWPDIIGPCYTSGSMQRELGVTRQGLSKAVSEYRALRLEAADGVTLYPAFQVRGRRLVKGLDRVLRALHEGFDSPMMWAQWLNAPVTRPDGEVGRRIDELAAGRVDELVAEARNTAAAWAA